MSFTPIEGGHAYCNGQVYYRFECYNASTSLLANRISVLSILKNREIYLDIIREFLENPMVLED
jgi:hypothetical protein